MKIPNGALVIYSTLRLLSTESSAFSHHRLSKTFLGVSVMDVPAAGTEATAVITPETAFVQPEPDRRQYRAIQLANGLKCLLVSAPESDVEAGAVHVKAGHMDDPADRPGLAHFHEHMLFLGTAKYPDENEYEQFLSKYGGSSNAYTDMEDTNYYFSVSSLDDDEEEEKDTTSVALEGGLDRLAQFFIAPKFDPAMVERELRAIDSEYRNSFTSDGWRSYQLLKELASPDHPFSKFGCGNYNTLTQGGEIINATSCTPGKSSPVQDLERFWMNYYRSYNLRLSVVGKASLDALQSSVERTFGQLPHSEGTPRHTSRDEGKPFSMEHAQYSGVPAFGQNQLGKMREVIPLVEARSIKLYFATPPLDDPVLKESRPYNVHSHLLGHESRGSLYVLLDEEGWLDGLSSGIGIDTSDFSLFTLTINLTKEGMKNKDTVLALAFQWIALIRDTSAEQMRLFHDELRQIAETNFRFRENGDPTDFCSSAAELLFSCDPAELLVASSRVGEYDPEVAKIFGERIRPDNAIISIMDSDLKADVTSEEWKKEKWYGAQYRETAITSEQMKEWTAPSSIDSRLALPDLNAYIPTDFSLRCDDDKDAEEEIVDDIEEELPTLLVDRPDLRVWYKMDRKWRVPKTEFKLSLLSPNVYRSPRTMTLNRIYERVLNDDLNSFVYDATVAGLAYKVYCVPSGYRISVKGYSEKISFLVDTLTSRMIKLIQQLKEGPDAHPGLALNFATAKASLLRETKNFRLDTPSEIASYNTRLVVEENAWCTQNYISEMEGETADRDPLTMQECARVAEECLTGRLKAESIIMGNINADSAMKIADVVDSRFLAPSRPLLDIEVPTFRSMKLPTTAEAAAIFGESVAQKTSPIVFQELVFSESEESNAIELTLQAGCDWTLGYEGVALLDLISHMAYSSAYNQLRTKEQLGYAVSSFTRKSAGGAWSLSVVIQSSVATPLVLQERCDAWLKLFRIELEATSPDALAREAEAVVGQLLERDTKLSKEVVRVWGEILNTEGLSGPLRTPSFDRLERLADQLVVSTEEDEDEQNLFFMNGEKRKNATELKVRTLEIFDKYFPLGAPERRAMSAFVYQQKDRQEFDANKGEPGVLSSYDEIRNLKQCLGTYPLVPYWGVTAEKSII
jgi:insulysin